MNTLEKLKKKCKYGVYVFKNGHKEVSKSVDEYIKEAEDNCHHCIVISDGVRKKMIETDTIIHCCIYPYDKLDPFHYFHHDLELCLKGCLEKLKQGDLG